MRGSFERDVVSGIAAALIYTVLLIAVAFTLRVSGIDLLGIYESLARH